MAEYLVTLSLLIGIVLIVRGLFRRSISPTVMYALWLVVVLRLCLPFPLFRVEMDLPAWQEERPQEQVDQQGVIFPGIDPDTVTPPMSDTPYMPDVPPVSTPTNPTYPNIPSVPDTPTVPGVNPVPDVPEIPFVPENPEKPKTPPAPIDWAKAAVTVWISGSAVLAVWFAITGIVYHYRLITHRTLYKTLRKTKVYLTEDESAPCLAGVIPAIYIPPVEMDDDARAFIVLHEYMHLRHGDHVWAVVRILALIAHWWNPLVWAAVILSKRDAELACDHAVAAQLNRENRLEYAHVLLDTIPQKHRYAVGLGSAPMKERILRLTKTQKNRILCVVLAVIITAAAVGCSFVHLTEKESPEEPPAFDFDLDTLCRHIADGDLSALDLFDASNEEFLQGQFNALHAYYSGTAEKAGGDWEAMPEGGVALPGELSFKNCEKFEYSTASQTPVVLRYDVGDYWLYAAFTLLDVGTTGDVSEILWHLSEAWFIPHSDAVAQSVADLAEWKIYSHFQNVGYTEWKTLKFYNQVTGESDYFSAAAGIKITSLQYCGGKVFVECDSHGFLIFDLTGGLYECLSTNKDTYIAYQNEYGAYIADSARWQSDSRLQARGENGIFVVTLFDGKYSLADVSLSESEILEMWQYNVGNAQKNNNAPQYHVPYGKLLNQVGSHVLDLFVMKGQAYLDARQAYDEEAATVPWLVYMIRSLDVSREEIVSALQKDHVPYTDAIVDVLFSEDDGRINETFHSPLALCHEGKVYTAYDLSLKITDEDSEEQKAFVRSIPKEDIIALIRAIQARDAMHGVVTPGEIVKLIYRLKDITLTAPGDEYAYGSYCYVHGMAYHSYPSALTDALDRDAFNAWHEESQWHTRENGCPFPQSNIYEFIHHFNIPKSRFVELYNERTIDDDYPIDLLYGGTAEAVDAYYRTSDPEKELESIKWANLRELKMHINAFIRDELHIQMKTSHCSLAELMYVAGIKAEELSSYYSKGHAVNPENRYDTIFDYDPAAVGYTTDASFEKVLARYTAYYLDCAICGLTPYDTPYDRQVSEMQNGSFTDKSLPDNFAEFYHEAERVYALFTGYRANIYTEGKFSDDGADYQAVDIDGCTTMAGLRALCEQYFDAALTDKLLSTTVMNQYPLYREHNGKLYRFSGYAAQFGYDIGDNYTMTSVQAENGKHTVRVDAVWNEGDRVITGKAMCTYTVDENGEIRFTSFDLMAQALCEVWGQGTSDTPNVEPSTLHDYKNEKLVNTLVYEGYTVAYELPHPTYEGQTFDFHIHLPQIDDDSHSAEKWNIDIVNAYDAKYSTYLSGSASGTNRNFYAEIRYETVTTGDVVTIYILNSCGVLNSGDARRSYDIYHYDTKGKRFLTTNEFLAYYAKGQFASSSVADIVAFMNEIEFNTDEAGTPIPLKEENIQGVIPSVFGDGKFDVVYQGYNMEGKFATRILFSPYPTHSTRNPKTDTGADYTYRLTYHDYTDCHTAEMNGQPAGYSLLICQRSAGKFDASWYVDRLFLEDIAERPESYPQSVYGEYYTPVRDDAYGNMYIVTDHKTDRGQLQAWIPFDQPSAAQDYYRGVLLGYFNYDRLFGGNAAVEKSVGGMIADVLDAYRNGKDPNELLPASETKFTPYPAKSVRANPGDKEIRAILDAATVDEEGIIRLRVDLGEGYILELPMDLGIFGESYQAYFTGIYFIKPQKVTTQGLFVGYVADKTTPWIDLYTEKNGTYVGRIPYEIFHDWIATDRDKDTWTPGWMGEYVCFYYAEFGDFRWAAAHLRDTVLGSGRKNVATSADGGKTWDIGSTRDNYGGNHVVGMGFATDKIAFISYDPYNEHDGADGPVISRTTDGGKTWKLLEISLPDSLGGQKLIAGIPFYDGDLLRYPVWLNPSHGTKEGEVMYLISRDKGMTWEWEDAGMTEYVVDIPLQDEKREFITCAAAYGTSHGNVPPHSNVIQPGQDGEIYYVMGVGDSYRSGGYFRTFKTYRVTSKGGYLVSVEETETFTKDVVLKNGKPYSGELDGMFTSLACRRSQQGNFNYELRSHSIYLQKDGTIDVSSTQVGTGPPVKYEGTYQYDGNTGTFAAKLTGSYSYEGNVTVYPETEVTGKLYEYGGFVHFICESSGVYALTVNDPLPLTFVPNTDGYANPSPVVLDDVYNGEWYYDFSDERGNQFYCLTIDTESAKMQFDYGFYESEYVNRYIGSYTVNPLSDVKTAVLRDSNAKHSDPEITLKFYLGYSKTNTGTTILLEVLSCDVPKYQHLVGKMISLQKKSVNADTQGGTESLSGVLSCILRGEDAFYDTAAKQRVFLTDWLKTNEMSVSKYSVIDLNGDGAPELVLWLNRGTNEYVGFLVLYDKNTTVYAHLLYYREFSDLKEDGTFDFSSGVSNHGIGQIDFEGDTYTIRKLAYCESADNQNVSYFLENKSVTKQAFDAYENAQNSKPDAIWVDCSIEAAPGYKQYTPAIEIDTSNREYIMPKAMYGESWPGANFDRTANIHPGVDGVGYITFGVCSDWKSSDYVSRYYTYRVTSAGGYIISVEEAETVTRDMVLKKGKPYTGSLEGQHTCVVNQMYYGITISGDTISASVGLYQTDAGGTGKGTYTYDPKTGKMSITTIEKYHDGNGNLLVNSPKTVTGKLYEYNDMVHFLYDDAKATPLPLSFPKINAFPPDRTDFIFDDLAGGWYHSFRDEKGDQFYCLALDPETQQICFAHGFYDGSYAARYAGTYRVDYNRIVHATLRDNNDPDSGEMKFVFSMGYSMGRDETGEMRTTINITPQVCDMENYRPMLGRYFGFKREKATTEELKEREEQYNFVMSAYEKATEAASWFRTASLVEAGAADGKDSIEYDGHRYYRVIKFDSYAELRQYLEEWFSASLVDQLLNDKSVASYITHNGKLYATPGMVPQNIRLGERYYTVSKVKDDWYILNVTVEVLDTKDLSTVLAYQSFQFDYQYKNGKWVFTGFPHIQ